MPEPPAGKRTPVSIRTWIAALLWLAVLPLTALHIRSTYRAHQLALANASTDAFALAEAVATSAEQLLGVSETQLTGIARAHADILLDPERCRALVDLLWNALGFMENLGAFSADGRGVCSTTGAEERAEEDFSERDWHRAALTGQGMFVAPPRIGSATRAWVIPMSVPIRSANGQARGVLMGTLPLVRLQDLLAGVEIGPDELATIATSEGVVIARSQEPARFVGTTVSQHGVGRTEVSEGRWFNRRDDLGGLDRTWAITRMRTVDWEAIAGIPTERIRGPALAASVRDWSLNALVVLVVVLVVVLIHRRVVGSLHDLVRGVGLAAAGRTIELSGPAPSEVTAVVEMLNHTLGERDRAEAAERKAMRRFRAIVDNAVFGIGTLTLDGRFLDVNPALVAMLGYTGSDELIAAGLGALYADPDERRRLVESHRDSDVIADFETEWLRRDGQPITVRLNGKTLTDPGSERVFEVIVEDITRSKILDEHLRHTQKMEAIGRLAGGVAHDFNNLLTVISLNGESLLAELDEDDPTRAELSEIAEAAARAEALTSQLLAFSRDEELHAEVLDPNDVVRGLERMLSRLLDESVRVETVLDPDVPAVFGDRGQLEQVIVNLVVNARDAMPEGGRIGISTSTASVYPGSGVEEGSWVCIAVEDEGLGLDEETRSHIFEPFFTTKPRGKGSGLGLATAYGIASRMGGHLGVASQLGQGSRFELWLPPSDHGKPSEPSAPDDAAERGLDELGGSETILVAEDEPQIRRVVERMLGNAGYRVLLARDGLEAIALAGDARNRIDLVLTDVVMPGAQGTDLADFVAEHRTGTPILFMSGHIFELPMRQRVDQSPESFLPKPFTASQLLTRIRTLLDRASVSIDGA